MMFWGIYIIIVELSVCSQKVPPKKELEQLDK